MPVGTVSGLISVTWDVALFYDDVTTGVTVHSINVPTNSTVSFFYDPLEDMLRVGGLAAGAAASAPNTNDYAVTVQGFWFGMPALAAVTYTNAAFPGSYFFVLGGSLTLIETPEPTTIAMFGLALTALAGVRRRRR